MASDALCQALERVLPLNNLIIVFHRWQVCVKSVVILACCPGSKRLPLPTRKLWKCCTSAYYLQYWWRQSTRAGWSNLESADSWENDSICYNVFWISRVGVVVKTIDKSYPQMNHLWALIYLFHPPKCSWEFWQYPRWEVINIVNFAKSLIPNYVIIMWLHNLSVFHIVMKMISTSS